MNKKVIAMAIAASMVAPLTAQAADVKISGRMAGDIVSMSNAYDNALSVADTTYDGIYMADYGQARVVFDFESKGWFARIGIDARAGKTMGSRDNYVGTSIGPGKLMVGRMGGAVKGIEKDAFAATFLELRNNAIAGGSYGSSSFIDGLVGYKMKAGDMNINVQYMPISISAYTSLSNNEGHYGVSLTGKAGDMYYYVGMNNGEAALANTGGVTKAGIKMGLGGMDLAIGYDAIDDGNDDTNRINAGVSMDMGEGMLDVTFATGGANAAESYTRIAYKQGAWHAGYVMNGSKSGDISGDAIGFGAVVKF